LCAFCASTTRLACHDFITLKPHQQDLSMQGYKEPQCSPNLTTLNAEGRSLIASQPLRPGSMPKYIGVSKVRVQGQSYKCTIAAQVCSLAHVAGLYKMGGDIKGRASVLSARGAVADMALWAIARVLTRVFASRSYKQCAGFNSTVHTIGSPSSLRGIFSSIRHLKAIRNWCCNHMLSFRAGQPRSKTAPQRSSNVPRSKVHGI
jgi:hypothetical protein